MIIYLLSVCSFTRISEDICQYEFSHGDFVKMLSAITKALANESIPPMCAQKISFKSVELRRFLASKIPPCVMLFSF